MIDHAQLQTSNQLRRTNLKTNERDQFRFCLFKTSEVLTLFVNIVDITVEGLLVCLQLILKSSANMGWILSGLIQVLDALVLGTIKSPTNKSDLYPAILGLLHDR